ncbi:precorrin-6A reductase [Dehalobacterium formicoaceticum]|uniref:Precorrin-6A reductase n=1 Tax=Dehalobacterium formicoaceticum TaxID=51515 RepID=A0ABT1Y500_9FIRM|nr:precorrin-6A reductase [Dehalobacterium formicoaceticum]MCR6544766.1 precorrin-6A reductase [Dehalobacterium formicoaceticum]
MILVLGGTGDALDIACALYRITSNVIISTATAYGFEVSQERFPGKIVHGKMDREALKKFILDQGIDYVVDASHPYAENLSRNAIAVCQDLGVNYLRFERSTIEEGRKERILCANLAEAGAVAENLPGRIFITTGINNIDQMISQITDKKRLTVRVLPQSDSIKKLEDLGLNPDHIIAMKGPFSEEMNTLMFQETQSAILICKDSGIQGGTDNKLRAAERLGMQVILIRRPDLIYPNKFSNIDEIGEYFKNLRPHKQY